MAHFALPTEPHKDILQLEAIVSVEVSAELPLYFGVTCCNLSILSIQFSLSRMINS